MLTIGQESSHPIEIDAGSKAWAVTFSANGEYIVSGHNKEVRVWGVEDGKQLAKMETGAVNCVAVSNDGKWIAVGTLDGVFVWDAATFRQAIRHSEDEDIDGVDFSPDSMRMVSSAYGNAIVWDLATRKQVQILRHQYYLRAAKYSPQGDRIATATDDGSVRLWDSNDGRLLVDIKGQVTPQYNAGLLWFNDHLLVVSDDKIKEFDAYTGSTVSESPIPKSNYLSCIALPKHRGFIAYSIDDTITFWDTSTHSQLALIQHPQVVRSIAFSPDVHFIAIGGEDGKITIKSITVSVLSCWIRHIRATLRVIGFHPMVSLTSNFSRI